MLETELRLLALSGSQRQASTNTAMLQALSELLPPAVRYGLFDGIGELPIFNPDLEGDETPESVLKLASNIECADGLIVASPEYVHGIPGGLKNALDWLVSRPEIVHKPILLLHASHRGDFALEALREVLATMSSRLVTEPILRVPLLGQSPEQVHALVTGGEHRQRLETALRTFLDDIASSLSLPP